MLIRIFLKYTGGLINSFFFRTFHPSIQCDMDKPLRSPEEIIINGITLRDILDKNEETWKIRYDDKEGIRAVLSKSDLSFAQLSKAKLSFANFRKTNLYGADLSHANLSFADLSGAYLAKANLTGTNLTGAWLNAADLYGANLSGANLSSAYLLKADLSYADFSNANLNEAQLQFALCIKTNLTNACMIGSSVYGISVWNILKEGLIQKNLIITNYDESEITVDDIEVAQFIYLILNNKKIRDVLDTITSKVVLILGRFTPERKLVLDAMREELRKYNYSPVVFDFDKPADKNITETVSTLAHLARFVIADITDAKSIPQELQRIVPDLPSLPVQPIILDSQYEYSMFKDFLDYPWVLLPHRYSNLDGLLANLSEKVIGPALNKSKEIEKRRRMIEEELSGK